MIATTIMPRWILGGRRAQSHRKSEVLAWVAICNGSIWVNIFFEYNSKRILLTLAKLQAKPAAGLLFAQALDLIPNQ